MKNNVTELVFILDRSGSMSGLESDTIGGFNAMIEKQKHEDGAAFVTTVLFSNDSETLHDRVPVEKVERMTGADYVPGGCTALLDAIGGTIEHISDIHRYARPEDVPERTIFVITTDGMENASHRYTSQKVKRLIGEKTKAGWEFLFLAANIDAVETAATFGIANDRAVNYHADKCGTRAVFESVSEAVSNVRARAPLGKKWREAVEKDYNDRN